ncbi:SDR family NAD(P)-dependent oxidoreductase [Lederbergia panacisoli]|uniref:SDR family NAD(P)-dependent oxidoreductase n=1 Tax=Lederbergia panacisoli TaxID=1255251 RepID=UPI00214C835E|nr:SDR family oxidoreductase [Lederbergia panacisoli]MCR2820315.1 SDR family oxidoreductase [Lederbergia panacisoli]
MKNERLKGKTVAITGASGGLGEQIAYICAQNGANLILLARNIEKLNQMSNRIHDEYGVKCTGLALDVSNTEEISHVFKQIYETEGEIDVLVNNAGYGVFSNAVDINLPDLEGMFAVNVIGLIACTKEVIPYMCKRRYGHIINIASQAGKLATPKSSVYAASKHAVLGFSNSLRMELSQFEVFVTAVNPGPIRTDFFQKADPGGSYLKNLGQFILDPEKVARNIVNIMLKNHREINMPRWMNWTATLHTLAPKLVELLGRKAFLKK